MSWAGQIIALTIPVYGPPDADGFPTVTGTVPGYHLNTDIATRDACLAADPGFVAFIIEPATPACIWAGDPEGTVCMHFADEAEARASALGAWWVEEENV